MLSVVVVPFGTAADLERCLGALVPQLDAGSDEVIVPCDEALLEPMRGLEARFPAVRFARVAGRRPPAELRAIGTTVARGTIVAFLEAHCIPAPAWRDSLVAAHHAGHTAVGGPIEKGLPANREADTALDWAVYFADFGRYMPPVPAGPARSLSDCNVSHRRQTLDRLAALWRTELHENVIHGALPSLGERLWMEPAMQVEECRQLSAGSALRDRLQFGRLFGASRAAGLGTGARLARALVTPLLLPVLVLRVARTAFARRRHRLQLARASGWLVVMSAAWLFGEAAGYLTGSAGRSLTPLGSTAPATR